MGFGRKTLKRARRAAKRHAKHLVSAVKRPDLTVAKDLRAAVKTAHPVTAGYGKFLATAYGIPAGGIFSAAAIAKSKNKKVFGGTGIEVAKDVVPIEKVGLAIGGGLIAGGIGSKIGGSIGEGIAPTEGGTSSFFVEPGGAGDATSFGASSSGGVSPLLIVGGGLVLVLVLVVALRR